MKKAYKPNKSTTKLDLQTKFAPKEVIRYWLPKSSRTWFRKHIWQSQEICKENLSEK